MKRIFFATDLHGSQVCYRKFLNAAKFYGADVLILGGDITGKLMIPFISQPDGNYRATFLGSVNIIKPDQLETTETMLADSGAYTFRTNPSEQAELKADETKIEKLFKNLMIQRLKQWLDLAEERLKLANVTMYMTGGNDDPFEIEDIIRSSSRVIDPEGQVVHINGYEIANIGYSNVTPWHCPRDISEEELSRRIEEMVRNVSNFGKCIFNFHPPPYDTPLDLAPQLREDLTPVMSSLGGFNMIHVGSTAVRAAIEKYQPLVSLHGHIHESKGLVKIGKSICVNPGSEYGEGVLRGVLLTLSEKKGIEKPEFTYG